MQIRIAFQGALLGLWFCFFAASFCYSNGDTIEVAGEQAAAKAFSELQRAEAAEVNEREKFISPPHTPIFPKKPLPPRIFPPRPFPPRPFFRPPPPPVPAYKSPPPYRKCDPYKRSCHHPPGIRCDPLKRSCPPPVPVVEKKPFFKPVPAYKKPLPPPVPVYKKPFPPPIFKKPIPKFKKPLSPHPFLGKPLPPTVP